MGRIKKFILGYPSPDQVLSRLKEFFGDPDFIRYESGIVGDQVRLRAYYDVTEESVEEAETADDPVSEFRRELVHLAWKSSGNV